MSITWFLIPMLVAASSNTVPMRGFPNRMSCEAAAQSFSEASGVPFRCIPAVTAPSWDFGR